MAAWGPEPRLLILLLLLLPPLPPVTSASDRPRGSNPVNPGENPGGKGGQSRHVCQPGRKCPFFPGTQRITLSPR